MPESNPFYQPGAHMDEDIRDWFGPSDIEEVMLLVQGGNHERGPIRTAFLLGQLHHLHEAVMVHLDNKRKTFLDHPLTCECDTCKGVSES